MQLETLFSFITTSVLLTLMPGPDIIYVLLQSISNGKKYGIATALGLVSGIIIHTTLVAFGVSELLKQNEHLFLLIKLFGACYLFYLAYKTYQATSTISISNQVEKLSLIDLYKKGFLMNVLNPKVGIFFLAFFPAFINTSLINTVQQIYLLGFIFMLQAFIVFSIVSIIADKMTLMLRNNPSFDKRIKRIQIILFIGIGILILI